VPLPRDIRRKLSELGRPKKAAPEPADTPADVEKEPGAAPPHASRDVAATPPPETRRPATESPAEAVPPPAEGAQGGLGTMSRQRLKERLQQSFAAEQDDTPGRTFGPAQTLEQVLPGEAVENEFGSVYVARMQAVDVMPGLDLAERFSEAVRRSDLAAVHEEFAVLAEANPAKVVFLDTETTGLASVPLFLCGIMSHAAGGVVIEQMLARDYTEEPAVLRRVQELLEATDVLVTYNGRTFDLPFIHDRMVYHLLDYSYGGEHIDLLPHARRLYRGVFPDCRLQTLEVRLCGFPDRTDDIPGDEIPQAYHDFVATSNAAILAPIVRHNARDLVTLCDVLLRIIAQGSAGRSG
jgi:uncharacterized protein YprB with RNaseH-like and TPR domain